MTLEAISKLSPPLILALIYNWMPRWGRENLFFGATSPPRFQDAPEGRAALRRYRFRVWLVTAASLAAAALLGGGPGAGTLALLAVTMASILAFAAGNREIAPHAIAPEPRAASLTPFSVSGWMLAGSLLPFAILAAAAMAAMWLRGSEKLTAEPLLAGAVVSFSLVVAVAGILWGTPRPAGESADWTRRFQHANIRFLEAMASVMAVVFASVALRPSLDGAGIPPWVFPVLPLIPLVAFAIPIFRLSAERGSGGDSTPDRCWYWGQFYYNPDDPAFMVERRFGIGYTFNFANRLAWLYLASLALALTGVRWFA
ncbi:MAG: DUF5808 domain-containing protein [Bryobacteraceae bacterium]